MTNSPYTFTGAQAARTVESADALLDLYPAAAQQALTELRADLAASASAGDPAEVIDDVFVKILAGRDAARVAGTLPTTATGTVTQLSVSNGGVPKLAVDHVEVDFGGVTTDRQGNAKHHGHPFQALCLWSEEVIADLQGAGHPIAAGSAGENITISGLDWASLTMGAQLRVGEVLMQLSSFAVPCRHQAQWFTDGDYSRLHHDSGQISRLYATVIEPGSIRVDDDVVVEPVGQ